MKSCESLISTPVRSRQDESSADDSICEESPYTYLSSQVFRLYHMFAWLNIFLIYLLELQAIPTPHDMI